MNKSVKTVYLVVTRFVMLLDFSVVRGFEVKKDADEHAEELRKNLPRDEQPMFDGRTIDQGRLFEVIPMEVEMEDHLEYVEGFMCGVDWQHEIGESPGGTSVYMDEEDLMAKRPCVEQCGIIQVRVNKIRWTQPQNFDWEKKK